MFSLLVACSEYGVGSKPTVPEPTEETEETEETTPDTETGTEPTDTGTEPTDTGTIVTVPASAPVYANTSDELFEIDTTTGARTRVGSFRDGGVSVDGMVDIAIDPSGRIYGGTYEALYQIDPLTASLSKICDTDLRPYALAFSSDGVLFAGAGPDIVEVNLVNCATQPLLQGSSYETSGDLVGLPDGYLYWTVLGDNSDELVRVDPVTGAAFWVGVVDESQLFGLGYDAGELYGFSSGGAIVRIDPLTAATSVVSSDGTSWWGATTNPVVW